MQSVFYSGCRNQNYLFLLSQLELLLPIQLTSAGQHFPPHNRTLEVGEFRVGGGDSYTFQCGLVGSFNYFPWHRHPIEGNCGF